MSVRSVVGRRQLVAPVCSGGDWDHHGTSTRREQFTPKLIEISQRKHGLCPCQVLGQATVSHLAKPHRCLTTRKACSPRARVRERARLIIRQRALSGR